MTMNLLDIIAPGIILGTAYLLLFTAFMDEVGQGISLRPEFPDTDVVVLVTRRQCDHGK
jgi:hypothetical protein